MFTTRNGFLATAVRSNDITSDGETIFKYAVFNEKGQQFDAGEIAATTMAEAKYIIGDMF